MVKLTVGRNDSEQRLDRFLRKYLRKAPLSYIYRIIRKDVKVNGSRAKNETQIMEGDEVTLYMSDADLEKYTGGRAGGNGDSPGPGMTGQGGADGGRRQPAARRTFRISYEDENILAAEKPYGLLTHGDSREKKNTLVNQVTDYLIEKGEYVPRMERSFSPAAVNRLDRNTTGIVLFGKNAAALRALNSMIRAKDKVSKYYLTVVCGRLDRELHLKGSLTKDGRKNMVSIAEEAEEGKQIETIARPVAYGSGFTLAEIELITGRTHQIRAHMASAGFPVAGDSKYGDPSVNRELADRYGLRAQLLHAYRLHINDAEGSLDYLKGREFHAAMPERQAAVCRKLFGSLEILDKDKI